MRLPTGTLSFLLQVILFIVCAGADEAVNLGYHRRVKKAKHLPSGLCFETKGELSVEHLTLKSYGRL